MLSVCWVKWWMSWDSTGHLAFHRVVTVTAQMQPVQVAPGAPYCNDSVRLASKPSHPNTRWWATRRLYELADG